MKYTGFNSLTKRAVVIRHDNDGVTHARAYGNTEADREALAGAGIPTSDVEKILAVWGDQPLIFAPEPLPESEYLQREEYATKQEVTELREALEAAMEGLTYETSLLKKQSL